MDSLFRIVSFKTSRLVTNTYSTSFSIGVRCLHPSIRDAIYSIYGFVRFADEIVDSFHDYDKEKLLTDFEREYELAVREGISMNPILNAFQETVTKYQIGDDLVKAFLKSMKGDLYKTTFTENEIKEYIYGSADVVGLMCLKVFVEGNSSQYEELKPYATRLGSAFQKVNFLRDLKQDTTNLHRVYFPVLKTEPFNEETKSAILKDIMKDFDLALTGIHLLPDKARFGVFIAYLYYKSLTKRIRKSSPELIMNKRISVPGYLKIVLVGKAYLFTKFS